MPALIAGLERDLEGITGLMGWAAWADPCAFNDKHLESFPCDCEGSFL